VEIDMNLLGDKRKMLIVAAGVILLLIFIGVGGAKGYKAMTNLWLEAVQRQREMIESGLQSTMKEKQDAIDKLQAENKKLKGEVQTLKVKYDYLIDRIKAKAQEAQTVAPAKDTAEAKAKLKGLGYEVVETCK